MKQILDHLRTWRKRDDVRTVLTATVLVASLVSYAVIFYLGQQPEPLPVPGVPLFLRLHPERLLACGITIFGMVTIERHLREEKPLLEPLAWIFFASLVHLSSLAIQFRTV